MGFFQKYFSHHIQQRISLKSKLAALRISYSKKSRNMGNKMGKFLNNVKCKKSVETPSSNVEEEVNYYFTPSEDLEMEHNFSSLSSETHDDTSPTYVCEICVEPRPLDISFNVKGCAHFYCIGCTVKYIESKLDDNVTRIPCPVTNCQGLLEPDFCRDILPRDLFNRWGKALCESAFLGSEKIYCPYKDCSALLINDGKNATKNFRCPFCKRVFCVQCKVAWHSGVDCAKFQKLKKLGSDAMLVDLAKRKKWRQCPKCNYYVEKSAGCYYVKCRCGNAFCYNCGAKSNRVTHFCSECYH
ncbi:probable E3 ubiquitin-protein ligase RNF217 [Durio zibethinus]|uniref:RBR-type E3 ubiquitin transferase n=1 Tax=Durio zibethinus TaxID=66656 RepID=A0A6P5XT39_DURZI|nr:probable E3 ubiquitin-protein ligase RNF217 [Durio zibethinus]